VLSKVGLTWNLKKTSDKKIVEALGAEELVGSES
jgi:hypothetical protein